VWLCSRRKQDEIEITKQASRNVEPFRLRTTSSPQQLTLIPATDDPLSPPPGEKKGEDDRHPMPKPKGPSPTLTDSELIAQAMQLDSEVWFAVSHWTKKHGFFNGRDRAMLYNMGKLIANESPLTIKQARHALSLLQQARDAGFEHEQLG
jgi:hypothetical protein